ncbi:hypothetical protein OB955_19415 [Halobacteria archaeon AArc-m2/3/4]|uniref:Right handed beta helix region n=1 Tax=Natronoglomus mannanivorans TaxID=2979990 RepID=A0ABT2QJ04_9EURY|nr:hypothetical protein [Halobacteria archaeon AArc-m2/3/4]
MVDETPRLNLNVYELGDTTWDHTDTVEALDEHAVEAGSIRDRPEEGQYDDELYAAIDQRMLWRWDATEGDWEPFGGLGTDDEPVPGTAHFESVQTKQRNNVFVAQTADGLQDAIDSAADNAWSARRGAVILRPHENYNLTDEVILRSNVTLFGNGACLCATTDANLIYAEPRTSISGPLELDTSAVNGYSSTALLLDGDRANTHYRLRTRDVVTVTGPVRLHGGAGDGTGLKLHTTDNGYITHCHFDLMIRGYETQVHCETPGGFANSNIINIEAVPVDTDHIFLHTGSNEAKLICFGHIQCGNANEIFVNETSEKSFKFWGHMEDSHWVEGNVVRGDKINVRSESGINISYQEWDLGTGTTVNNIGVDEADQEEPSNGEWNAGNIVDFTDTGDGSGDGIYLKHLDGSWIQID